MKERTLKHLLLLTSKAIENANVVPAADISDVRRTLTVSRERRGPYQISWSSHGEHRALEIADSSFEFHVRGDVAHLVAARSSELSQRKSNWDAAIVVWSQILGVSNLELSSYLAPTFTRYSNQRNRVVLQVLLCVLSSVALSVGDTRIGVTSFAIGMASVVVQWASFRRSTQWVKLVAMAAIAFIGAPVAGYSTVVLIIESIVSFLNRQLVLFEKLRLVGAAIVCGLVWFLNFGLTFPRQQDTVVVFLFAVLLLVIAILQIPRGSGLDTTRISVPMAALFTIFLLGADPGIFVGSLVMLLGNLGIKSPNSEFSRPGTPVAIRRRSS